MKNTNPAGTKRLFKTNTQAEKQNFQAHKYLQSRKDITFQNRGQIHILSELINVLHSSRLFIKLSLIKRSYLEKILI